MKEWYSFADLADLGLPHRGNKRAWRTHAEKYGWYEPKFSAFVKTEVVQGGEVRLYHIRILPDEVQGFLIETERQTIDGQQPLETEHEDYELRRETMWRAYGEATNAQKKRAEFRHQCVAMIRELKGSRSHKAAVNMAHRKVNKPIRTLEEWLKLVDGVEGVDYRAALLPSASEGRPPKEIDPRIMKIFKGLWLRLEQPSMKSAYDETKEAAESLGLGKVPGPKTLRAHVRREIGEAGIIAAREGKEALADLYPHLTRTVRNLHAMHTVNSDGHVCDVFVRWEDGTVGRPMLLGFQDVYSRMLLSHRIGRTENTELIRLAISDMVRKCGIPELCYFDNGRAFTSKSITGNAAAHRFRGKIKDEDPVGVFAFLDVEVKFVKPYHGQSKPIERAWRDIADRVAKHISFAGAYTGNKVDAKPENYGSHAVPIEEFRTVVENEIIKHNQRTGRNVEMGKGKSFSQIFRESLEQPNVIVRKPTQEQMNFCLLASEEKAVQKRRGEIGFYGNRFWSDHLTAYRGKKVMIRFDPEDLALGLHVYTRQGVFICHAVRLEEGDFNSVQAAQEHAKRKANFEKSIRARKDAAEFFTPEEIAEMLPKAVEEVMPFQQVVGMHFAPLEPNAGDVTRVENASDAFSRGLAKSMGVSSIFDHPKKDE